MASLIIMTFHASVMKGSLGSPRILHSPCVLALLFLLQIHLCFPCRNLSLQQNFKLKVANMASPTAATESFILHLAFTGNDNVQQPNQTISFTIGGTSTVFITPLPAPGQLTLSAVPPAAPASTSSTNNTSSPSRPSCPSCPSRPSCASSTSSNYTPHVSPGLATGSAVGLAFGCLFAGALLALALAFFCLRRRETFPKQTSFQRRLSSRGQGGNEVVPLAKPPSNSFTHVLERLPAPITHTQFEKEASQWNTSIQNYVANHVDRNIDLSTARGQTLLASDQLSTLAGHDAPWHRLLRDKTTRYNALRMLIARIIANRVDPETAAEASLLPQTVLGAYQDIVAGGRQNCKFLVAISPR